MPIRPSEKKRYPTNWKEISLRIRARSGGQCECWGECKSRTHSYVYRCPEFHGRKADTFKGKVVLTVAHLDHAPENCDDKNLRAMCQKCHLVYDQPHHSVNARKTREAKNPQMRLF